MEQYINRLPLAEVTANTKNPRTISEARLQKLIDSLLVFPRMLYMRPVIIDGESVVLGGNMRLEALHRIARMTMDDITARLEGRREYEAMSEPVREKLRSLWASFLGSPTVPCVRAADLTADEREQFIIKDNVSFGDWDWSELETWDADKLTDWGVGVEMPDLGGGDNLPEEIRGKDIMPDRLEKLQGSDNTLMQRVIITFRPEQADILAKRLGLDEIDKVVYRLDDIL